jgi:hypothetical protein
VSEHLQQHFNKTECDVRCSLRRRFLQNLSDASDTVMEFLPHMEDGILRQLDVESLANELQVQTNAARARGRGRPSPSLMLDAEPTPTTTASHEHVPTESSMRRDISPAPREHDLPGASHSSSHFTSGGENHTGRESDAHSDVVSISGTSVNGTDASHNSDSPVSIGLTMASSPSISSQAPSWVEGYDSQHPGAAGPSHELTMPTSLHQPGPSQSSSVGSPRSHVGAYLSDSYMSDSYTSTSFNASDVERSRTVCQVRVQTIFHRIINSIHSVTTLGAQ